MKVRKHLWAQLLAGALLLSACGGAGDGGGGSSPTESIAPPVAQDINVNDRADLEQGGTVRLAVAGFGRSWNPLNAQGSSDDLSRVRQALLPQFFTYDARGVASPDPNWVVSAEQTNADPTTVHLTLNPAAVWGDGSPVDADDLIATWKACDGSRKDFDCASTRGYDQIAKIEAGADKFDVTVTFKGAYPDWTQPFSSPGTLKAESVKNAKTFDDGWRSLNPDWLSGPFTVQGYDDRQQLLTLVPNSRWWGDRPLLDKITYQVISPEATAEAFTAGRLDSFDIGSDLDAYRRVKGVPDASIRQAAGPSYRQFTFNTKSGVLADQKVRQAIVKGLDRRAIGRTDLAGIDWPVQPLNNNILLATQEGYRDVAQETGIAYDPEGAKADLDALGWTVGAGGIREYDGKRLEIKFSRLSGVSVSQNEARQAQQQLKEIGVQLDIVDVPLSALQDGSVLTNHEFDMIAFSWTGSRYPLQDVGRIYGTDAGSNFSQLSDPRIDENAEQLAGEMDPARRIDLANETAKIIWGNVMTLPLYQRPELVAAPTKLANYGAFGLGSPQWENVGYEK